MKHSIESNIQYMSNENQNIVRERLRHGSLFSGIGGFDLAAEWMGWENVFSCEINPFGRRVLEYYWPNAKHYEDINKTDFTIHRGGIDVLTGGFPCFAPDTQILTNYGLKNIASINVGDFVLTKEGRYMPVNAVMDSGVKETVCIKYQGDCEPLVVTGNHPLWVKKRELPYARKYRDRFSSPTWTNASDILKGDLIGMRIYEGINRFNTEAFWYLVGRYVGDGWIIDGKRTSKIPQGQRGSRVDSVNHKVYICCSHSESDSLLQKIKEAGYNPTIDDDRTVTKFIINSKSLVTFLRQFGRYAHGKKLPGIAFDLEPRRKEMLFRGWLDADGYVEKNGSLKVTTVSSELARGMAIIARDVFRRPVSITKKTTQRECRIEGRLVKERPQYCVSVSPNDRYGYYEDGFLWVLVKNASEGGFINTYNIGVYEDESYTANGIVAHNCQPFSQAGKRKGTEDDRHLWPRMLEVIRDVQPRWVVGENVYGLVNWDGGMVFEQIQVDLENEGYEVQPVILPAVAVNAPHRRDRIWFVAQNANHYGWSGHQWEKATKDRKQRNSGAGNYEWIQVNHGKAQIATNTHGNGQHGRNSEHEKHAGEGGVNAQHDTLKNEGNGNVADTERIRPPREKHGQKESRQRPEAYPRCGWENFPTQSPIRSGDDGIQTRLDGITFPKWRNESIKAYGNSVVVPLVYEIFKTIELYESEIQKKKG